MNPQPIIADTNIFLRYFLKDNPEQSDQAKQFLRRAKIGKIELIIPQIVIFEIVFAFSKLYGFSKDEIISKVDSLLAAGYLKIQDQGNFKKAVGLYRESNLSLADCFLIAKAREIGAEIFTFDKDLKKISSGLENH